MIDWKSFTCDTMKETAWEREMNVSGFNNYTDYRDGLKSANGKPISPEKTKAGEKFIRKLLKDATQGIKDLQESIIGNRRAERSVRGTLLLVPADTMALICLKVMIDKTYATDQPARGVPLTTLTTTIGKAVEIELEFRTWIEQSREAAREYAEKEGLAKVPVSQAERLLKEKGVKAARSLSYWRREFEVLKEYQWTNQQKRYCGDALVHAVVDALPDRFEYFYNTRESQNQKFIRMTDTFREEFGELDYRLARMQTVKKPMLSKPVRWQVQE